MRRHVRHAKLEVRQQQIWRNLSQRPAQTRLTRTPFSPSSDIRRRVDESQTLLQACNPRAPPQRADAQECKSGAPPSSRCAHDAVPNIGTAASSRGRCSAAPTKIPLSVLGPSASRCPSRPPRCHRPQRTAAVPLGVASGARSHVPKTLASARQPRRKSASWHLSRTRACPPAPADQPT